MLNHPHVTPDLVNAIGRPAQEFPANYREWMVDFGTSGYIALYHFDGQTIVIFPVRHQKELGY